MTARPTGPRKFRAALTVALIAIGISGLAGAAGGAASYSPSFVGVPGEQASTATAISPAGDVVGSTLVSGNGWRAFLRTSRGSVVDLGTLGGPYSSTFGVDVNAAGQVVGIAGVAGSNDPQRGFFWSQATGMVDLGTIGADTIVEPAAINADGRVAGTSWASNQPAHAFTWTQAGGIVDLGSLGGVGADANDVNDTGHIVGISSRGRVTPPGPHAFVWSASGGMRDLGTLGGSASEATSVNEQGDVVGWALTTSQQTHAFLWSASAGMRDLGTLGGSESRAVAIGDAGLVIGTSTTATGAAHAFSWTAAEGMLDLGTAVPTGVNSSGQIVGYGPDGRGAERPLLWDGGTATDLGSLDAPQGRALAINDRAEIVGFSHAGGGWSPKALLWVRTPVTPIIGQPTAVPPVPLAGRRFTVSFPVVRSDTRAPLASSRMTARVTIAGKRAPSKPSFGNGRARVVTDIPRGARGQLLRVKVTVVLEAASATRTAAYRVR